MTVKILIVIEGTKRGFSIEEESNTDELALAVTQLELAKFKIFGKIAQSVNERKR